MNDFITLVNSFSTIKIKIYPSFSENHGKAIAAYEIRLLHFLLGRADGAQLPPGIGQDSGPGANILAAIGKGVQLGADQGLPSQHRLAGLYHRPAVFHGQAADDAGSGGHNIRRRALGIDFRLLLPLQHHGHSPGTADVHGHPGQLRQLLEHPAAHQVSRDRIAAGAAVHTAAGQRPQHLPVGKLLIAHHVDLPDEQGG